jgi:hypothetical protein
MERASVSPPLRNKIGEQQRLSIRRMREKNNLSKIREKNI